MSSERKHRIYKSIMLVLLSVLITFLATTVFMYKVQQNNTNTKYVLVSDNESNIGSDLSKIKTIIDKYYLGEVDDTKLKESAIKRLRVGAWR